MPTTGIGGSEGEIGSQKPCRACSDFTSWAKIQKGAYQAGSRRPPTKTDEIGSSPDSVSLRNHLNSSYLAGGR